MGFTRLIKLLAASVDPYGPDLRQSLTDAGVSVTDGGVLLRDQPDATLASSSAQYGKEGRVSYGLGCTSLVT